MPRLRRVPTPMEQRPRWSSRDRPATRAPRSTTSSRSSCAAAGAVSTMRVAQLVRPHRFEFIEQAVPEPGPGEIRVRVNAVGLCGSDLHYFSEGSIGDTQCLYPMVLGHEPAGVIDKLGPGVSGWSAGDRAVFE